MFIPFVNVKTEEQITVTEKTFSELSWKLLLGYVMKHCDRKPLSTLE